MEEQDKKVKDTVIAKNNLESFIYNVRNTMNDKTKGLADKLSEEEMQTIKTAVDEGIEWLDSHPTAEKEEFDDKRTELEKLVQPILAKAYGGQAPPGGAGFEGGAEESSFHDDL